MLPGGEAFTLLAVCSASLGVIAQGRLDQTLGMVCGSHLMYAIVETAIGDTRVQVVEPRLVDARGDEWLGS